MPWYSQFAFHGPQERSVEGCYGITDPQEDHWKCELDKAAWLALLHFGLTIRIKTKKKCTRKMASLYGIQTVQSENPTVGYTLRSWQSKVSTAVSSLKRSQNPQPCSSTLFIFYPFVIETVFW